MREPKALALATADKRGRPSSRIVAVNEITEARASSSLPTRQPEGPRARREPLGLGDPVLARDEPADRRERRGGAVGAEQAEEKWLQRPVFTYPVSVVSRQSEELVDVKAMRAEIDRLAEIGGLLPRPDSYVA